LPNASISTIFAAVMPIWRRDKQGFDPDDVRMSFGDHLEELRTRVVRLLLGGLVGMVVCFIFSDRLMMLVLWPLDVAYRYNGLTPEVITIEPTEIFVVVMKVSIYCGLIFTAPWGLYQLWAFVAAGLYAHEQRWAKQFFPVSVALFTTGVVFCFAVVLPLVFSFLIGIRSWVPSPEAEGNLFTKRMLPETVTTQPVTTAPTDFPVLPLLYEDPCDPCVGQAWVDVDQNRIKVRMPDGISAISLVPVEGRSFVKPQLALSYVISFVLRLALGFGIGFQVPIVVVLLAVLRIVSISTMGSARRYVLLIMVAISAVVTPPDVTSQILLAVPMYCLYEGGMLAARIMVRRRDNELTEDSEAG
jgi:Tat protein translocase TatC